MGKKTPLERWHLKGEQAKMGGSKGVCDRRGEHVDSQSSVSPTNVLQIEGEALGDPVGGGSLVPPGAYWGNYRGGDKTGGFSGGEGGLREREKRNQVSRWQFREWRWELEGGFEGKNKCQSRQPHKKRRGRGLK